MEAGHRRERKVVTVLFADLVGFTARAESLDPEAGCGRERRAGLPHVGARGCRHGT